MTPRLVITWVLAALAALVLVRITVDVLRNPWTSLDLEDAKGKRDHGKVVGLFFVTAVLVLRAAGITFGVWELIVLTAGVFGSRMFLAFLKNRSSNLVLTESRAETVTRTQALAPAAVTTEVVTKDAAPAAPPEAP